MQQKFIKGLLHNCNTTEKSVECRILQKIVDYLLKMCYNLLENTKNEAFSCELSHKII